MSSVRVEKVWHSPRGYYSVSLYIDDVGPSYVHLDEEDLTVQASHWGLTVPSGILEAAISAAQAEEAREASYA